jgi:hypothetical protein
MIDFIWFCRDLFNWLWGDGSADLVSGAAVWSRGMGSPAGQPVWPPRQRTYDGVMNAAGESDWNALTAEHEVDG